MKGNSLSRRRFMSGAGAAIGAVMAATGTAVGSEDSSRAGAEAKVPFRYCFNTSTIRGQKLSLDKEIEITAKADYNAIEPWVDKIHAYVRSGGNLNDVRLSNTVIASHDMVAADAYAATLFDLSGEDIAYVKAAANMGLGTLALDSVKIEEIAVG